MNVIAKGCGQSLLVWGLAGAGLYWYFHPHFEAPSDMWAAIGGGFLVSCAYGSLLNARLALVQRKLIRSSRTSVQMQDGKPTAVVGKIRALKSPLLSPFKQRPCVAYGYNIDCERQIRSRSTTTKDRKSVV